VLAALTFARTVMGFQFETVPALATPVMQSFGLRYFELGSIVGLYLLPGIAVALPGGVIARRFGDKRVVSFGLAAMAIGSILMAVSENVTLFTAGRLISGTGAVFLNVLVTKMVSDWFEGEEIATALGVLVSSWPLGIAIALLAVPPLAAGSWPAGMWMAAGLSCVAFLIVLAVYQPPSGLPLAAPARLSFDLSAHEAALAVLSGLVWAFYNMGLILLLTFGPAWLISTGANASHAGAVISIASWIVLPAIPIGAFLAERAGHPNFTMVGCFLFAAAAIATLPSAGDSAALIAVIGILFGPAAGLIMVLPGQAAQPDRRALAMGVYFTCYYVGMGVAPPIAGFARDATGSAAAPMYVASSMLIAAAAALLAFRLIQKKSAREAGQT
jgi:MFS family permease